MIPALHLSAGELIAEAKRAPAPDESAHGYKVVANVRHDLPPEHEGYEIISRRIEALVHDGRLLAQGDTKNWRFSEVRLKPN